MGRSPLLPFRYRNSAHVAIGGPIGPLLYVLTSRATRPTTTPNERRGRLDGRSRRTVNYPSKFSFKKRKIECLIPQPPLSLWLQQSCTAALPMLIRNFNRLSLQLERR